MTEKSGFPKCIITSDFRKSGHQFHAEVLKVSVFWILTCPIFKDVTRMLIFVHSSLCKGRKYQTIALLKVHV